MKIDDLYTHELCEDEDPKTIDKIVAFLKEDGFDLSDFMLVQTGLDIYEFYSTKNPCRGFNIFYDPKVLLSPVPQYQLHYGFLYYSFNARSVTEAYLLHNKELSKEDYELLEKSYGKTEKAIKPRAKSFSQRFGEEAACAAFNFTNEFIRTDNMF